MGKIVNYLATSITVTQRHFNQSVLHTFRILLDGIRDMNTGSAEMQQNYVLRMKSSEQQIKEVREQKERLEAQLELQFNDMQKKIDYLKTDLIFQQRRFAALTEAAQRRLPSRWDQDQVAALANEADHIMDPFYVAFEDQFRGQRSDIKERLSIYLPIVEQAGAGKSERPIIDLGCGRGEWLELVKESGLSAQGIDMNHLLVEDNQKRGLDVIESDAFDYLGQLPESQLGAVTAFHLIEHLPHNLLVKLMDESLRVLKSGGVAIFETPNPQNLTVGASTFYADPTHKKPLHPDTQKFLMEYRGFARVELRFLHPLESHQLLPAKEAPHLAAALNSLLGCARDYAVIGYKV
jgi:O-antigen chain-terminating methyltransferase